MGSEWLPWIGLLLVIAAFLLPIVGIPLLILFIICVIMGWA